MKKSLLALAVFSALSHQAFAALEAGVWVEGQKQEGANFNSLTVSKSELINGWSSKTTAGVLVNNTTANFSNGVGIKINDNKQQQASGIAVQNGGIANFNGGDVDVNVNATGTSGNWVFGVIVEGKGSTVNFNKGNVHIASTKQAYTAQTLTIGANSIGNFNNDGDVVVEAYSPYGVTGVSGYGKLTFNNEGNVLIKASIIPGKTSANTNVVGMQGNSLTNDNEVSWKVTNKVDQFKIELSGAGVDNDGTSYSTGTKGISAYGDKMNIDINSKQFVINMDIANNVENVAPEGHTAEQAYGIWLGTGTKLTVGANTTTSIKIREGLGTGYGVYSAYGASATFEGNTSIDVEGLKESYAVLADGDNPNGEGQKVASITFNGHQNNLTGNVVANREGTIDFNQGTTTIKGNIIVDDQSKLTMKEASIELAEGHTAKIDGTLTSQKGQLFVNEAKENLINVASLSEGSTFTIGATGKLNDQLGGDIDAFSKTFTINQGAEQADILMQEGLVAGEVTAQLNQDGSIDKSTLTEKTNSVMESSLEIASYLPMAMTRVLTNDVRKRMGDLRASDGKSGAWARYDGGKFSGENGFDSDFHTIQVGIDTVPTPDSARFGLAFSYTDGDSEYVRTKSDMSAFSLAGYATWMADNGLFVDGVLRLAKVNNDVTVDRNLKGSMDNIVLSASAETGWRYDLNPMFYVEPQAEVMYTYVDGDKFDIGAAQYSIDASDSFTTRLGLASGIKCPNNKGDFYVRASVVHEFLGDSKVTGSAQGSSGVLTMDGKDTWIEYGFGGNINLTKNTYLWADVERSSGSTLDTDYRATFGIRHSFD